MNQQVRFRWHTRFFLGFFLLLGCFGFTSAARAASLYLSPASGTYTVGKTFSVNVFLSSPDQAANAVSSVVTFPTDKLQVTSVSKSGSTVSLWVQEPSFSNSAGTVRFEGIMLNPGYKGSGARLVTLNFRVRATGEATVAVSSGSVLANDGEGTNILSGRRGAKFTLRPASAEPGPTEPAPVERPAVPNEPRITSESHPDSLTWYNDNDPVFSWELPPGATGVAYSIDHTPDGDPGRTSKGVMSSYTAKDVEDGSWYFHIRVGSAAGWSAPAHYRFQVDTRLPDPFTVTFIDGENTDNPAPRLSFSTSDSGSGIKLYRVKVDNGDYFDIPPSALQNKTLTLKPQTQGKHTVIVHAADFAGNTTTAVHEFFVKALQSPVITEYPAELDAGDPLIVRGTTFPNAKVTVLLSLDKGAKETFAVVSGEDGQFVFTAPKKPEIGIYQVSAYVTDARGATSASTDPVVIIVREPPFIRFGAQALDVISIFVPLFAVLLLLFFIVVHAYRRLYRMRGAVVREADKAETVLHELCEKLKADLEAERRRLEATSRDRPLMPDEEKLIRELENKIVVIEQLMMKEMESIEEAVGVKHSSRI